MRFANLLVASVSAVAPVLAQFGTFDYVVIGAGNSGMTLAGRLSEDPSVTVAVIEAGDDYKSNIYDQTLVNMPGADTIGCGASETDFLNNGLDWNFITEPQAGANNRKISYARGKAIGGTTVRNYMLYQRPSKAAMDRWVALTGDASWSFDNRFEDFKKTVSFTPPRHDLRKEIPAARYDASSYGPSGPNAPVQVSYPRMAQNFSSFMQGALNEAGIPTTDGFNAGRLLGTQYSATTIDPIKGERSTSRVFWEQAVKRSNFKIYTKTYAKKILFDKTGAVPKATGVAISSLPWGVGQSGVITARKEVIISAGAFQSPQLLMVSGIGPKAQLDKFKIPIVVANAHVGQNLIDHIFFGPSFPVDPATGTLTDIAASPALLLMAIANMSANALGPLTNNVADFLGWERIPSTEANAIGAGVLNSYPSDWPAIEYLSAPGLIDDFSNLLSLNANAALATGGKRFATILAALVAPQSRGSVTLASADAAVLPKIDPKWLTHPADVAAAIWAFKRTRKFFATAAMAPVLAGSTEYTPGAAVQTDAQILAWIRKSLMTVWHPASTARMGLTPNDSVLDSKMRVWGTANLRVVDASAFPDLPAGHPMSVCYMIAERAATLILREA